jgi:hypothetical protein
LGIDSDRVSNTVVPKLAAGPEPVDRRRAHAQQRGHLTNGEKLAYQPEGFVVGRGAVQQGSSNILAQAWMGLHILAFLVGHTSRICTGLHVLARI